MKRTIIAILMLSAIIPVAQSQNEVDALRYSQLNYSGSARFLALGGAFGALGADFSTLSTNPAGIGLYRKSEFSFTPLVFVSGTSSEYNNQYADDRKASFSLGNIGVVYAMPFDNASKGGWQNFHFGFGINRLNDFNNRMMINGFNTENSLLDAYVHYADGIVPEKLNEFDTRLAWDTWLLDTIPGTSDRYFSAIPDGNVFQRQFTTTWGSMNEFVISLGSNFDDRLYLGATFGFPWIRYFEETSYREVDEENNIYDFDQFVRRSNLDVRGTGFVFKGGLIFRPVNYLRLGAAIHTPTWYRIREDYSTFMESYFDNGDNYQSSSPELINEYRLETPMRLMGSVAFIMGNSFLLSGEYEYVDYSLARLRPQNHTYQYYNENDAIRSVYTISHVVRGGAELRLDNVSLRVGAGYSSSPFKDNINDGSRISFSGGFGFRDQNYFLDLAYVYSDSQEDYYMYDPALVNKTINETVSHKIAMTLGFRF